jgi:TonB-linked SusC/RagA family outer membrane protein
MKNKISILFILLFAMTITIFGQNSTIKGVVRDSKTNEPLIGVTVLVQGEKVGTITNVNGEYSISLSQKNASIVFSYIGYVRVITKAGNSPIMNIQMSEDNKSLNEVVVVGYGTQKKATITGSVDNINSDKLNMSFSSNLQNQLTGKLAGVRVIQKTGEPGKFNSEINIRGLGAPLIIIDGVASTMDMFNRLAPSEIDNVSVLKDASAAVYGMKAGNGVLLITTRKGGSKDGKPQIDYQGNLGFSSMVNLNAPMNAYDFAIMQNEIRQYKLDPLAPLYDAAKLEQIKNTPGLNVYDAVMRASNPIENHTVSVSGNVGEKYPVKYFLFGNYLKEYGLLRSGDLSYKRYNIRSNVSAELGNGLSVDVNLAYVTDNKEEPYNDVNQLWKSIWGVKPVDDEGNVLASLYANNDGQHYLKIGQTGYNPLPYSQSEDVGYMQNSTSNFRGQMALNWDIPFIKGLKAKYLYTYERNDYNYKDFRKGITFLV